MYSDKKNVVQLIALLKAHGIRQVVLCPGSRNAPVTHSLTNDPYFTCHSVVDERSAGFYALGIIQHEDRPAALCCTSGTAVLNLSPAVAEACYQELPLIVISADRPQPWIGQMDGQTIPQPAVFNTLVKRSVQLPEVCSEEDEWYCNRLINEALLEPDAGKRGPVHINIPLSEPLFGFSGTALPVVRKIERHDAPKPANELLTGLENSFLGYRKKMLAVGQCLPGKIGIRALETLADKHDCLILSELLSNTGQAGLTDFDTLLYALPEAGREAYAPDLLITMGGHIVSKRLKEFIRKYPPKRHWHVSVSGEVVDTYRCLTDIVQVSPCGFISHFACNGPPSPEREGYRALWDRLRLSRRQPPVPDYSDLLAIQMLAEVIPANSSLHLANSSAVRLAHLFPLKNTDIQLFSNRGTSGIDGCVSTAVGYAAASDRLTFLLTGDLAFFFDMNGLWNRQVGNNLRIMLNNNGGGGIFHTLPGLRESDVLKYISARHDTSAGNWAETTGFTYIPVRNRRDLEENIALFAAEKSDKPILMEVFTSMEENDAALRAYYHAIKQQ